MRASKPALTPRPRVLDPGSPEQIRRDELLAIMRDDKRPQHERDQAALGALPLCYVRVSALTQDPSVTIIPIRETDDAHELLTKLLAMQGLSLQRLH